MGERPASVRNAIRVQAALVLVSGLTTLLTVVRRDDLVATWTARQPSGQPPAFAPVVVVLFVTFALLVAVLVVFFRDGHPSARWSLTGLALFHALAMVAVVRLDPPADFLVLVVLSAALDGAVLALLWHRDTSAFLRAAPAGSSAR